MLATGLGQVFQAVIANASGCSSASSIQHPNLNPISMRCQWGAAMNGKPFLHSSSPGGDASVMTYYFDKTLTAENTHSLRRKSSTDEAIFLDW